MAKAQDKSGDQSEESVSQKQEARQAEASGRDDNAGAGEQEPLDELQQALESAMAQIDAFKDQALRAEAEMQNVRRRAERDVANAHKFGLERFLTNLLPVVDALEKSIEAAEQAAQLDDPITEGVRLCLKLLTDQLDKENVAAVDPVGEPFDPQYHQALSMIDSPDMEPNSVVLVVQKGYTLNERLVRPALVMVSKGPSPHLDEEA